MIRITTTSDLSYKRNDAITCFTAPIFIQYTAVECKCYPLSFQIFVHSDVVYAQ